MDPIVRACASAGVSGRHITTKPCLPLDASHVAKNYRMSLSAIRYHAGADERAIHVGGPRAELVRVSSGRADSLEGGHGDLDACPRADLAIRKAGEQLASQLRVRASGNETRLTAASAEHGGDNGAHELVALHASLAAQHLTRFWFRLRSVDGSASRSSSTLLFRSSYSH